MGCLVALALSFPFDITSLNSRTNPSPTTNSYPATLRTREEFEKNEVLWCLGGVLLLKQGL